ncbi:MAG: DUF4058 family protein [Caldilineaceae bacterium]|nr:DUF4058 family protein [Caldilineaceae bacterium]HRJ42651.1 DUF4058 family protein [Caldilineaceae bacterium]
MPTPFPGMDPYLERPGIWEGVHTRLLVAISDALTPRLRPNYRVDIERRTYLAVLKPDDLVGILDVLVFEPAGPVVADPTPSYANGERPLLAEIPVPEEVVERYLEIRDTQTAEVVTVIEVLSPANKTNPTGRQEYNTKREKVLASRTNLIEIDLLRAGEPPPIYWRQEQRCDYRVVVSRGWQRPRVEVYCVGLRQPLPTVPVPLRRAESEPGLELNRLLHELYDRAGYDMAVDYSQPPTPPLAEGDAGWANELLALAGLRPAG